MEYSQRGTEIRLREMITGHLCLVFLPFFCILHSQHFGERREHLDKGLGNLGTVILALPVTSSGTWTGRSMRES